MEMPTRYTLVHAKILLSALSGFLHFSQGLPEFTIGLLALTVRVQPTEKALKSATHL